MPRLVRLAPLVTLLCLLAGRLAAVELTSVVPDLLSPAGGQTVRFIGADFQEGDVPRIAGLSLTGVTFVNARELRGTTPDLPVGIHTADVMRGGRLPQVVAFLRSAVTVAGPPVLRTVSPESVPRAGGLQLTIRGANFRAETVVRIGAHALGSPQLVDAETITGVAPALDAAEPDGAYPASAEDTRGRSVLPGAVTYFTPSGPPVIRAVDPPLVPTAGGPRVTFLGENFKETMTPRLGGRPLTAVAFIDATRIEGTSPALAAGLHDADLVPASGAGQVLGTLDDAVEAGPAPRLAHVEPAEVCAAGGTRVVVYGTGLRPQTRILFGRLPLLDPAAADDGSWIAGRAPPLGAAGVAGPQEILAEDPRGGASLRNGVAYLRNCSGIPGPQQIESSLAEGTARFSWSNPAAYASILVLDEAGNTLQALSGDASFIELPSGGAERVAIQLKGVTSGDQLSDPSPAVAVRHQCEYPPPLDGNVEAGSYEYFLFGDHDPASIARCTGGGAGEGGGAAILAERGAGGVYQAPGTTGLVLQSAVKAQALVKDFNKVTTGFTLDEDADKLEISGFYQKLAAEFGLSLRGRLIHVFPADGFQDEFTFPDPLIGQPKEWHSVTYFRATGDASDSQSLPCLDGQGELRKIPAGEYLLDIYAVGGDRKLPYYVFADDPRDNEILIQGVPCPPYPLVRVRDLTGFPSLPNVEEIEVDEIQDLTGFGGGFVVATFTAHGTWLDAEGSLFSIENECDHFQPRQPFGLTCADPPYQENPDFEYTWAIHVTEPPLSLTSSTSTISVWLPDFGCYKIELTVRDKRCAVSRKSQHEVAIVPVDRDICTPNNPYFSYVFPTPDPAGICAITDLSPPPGDGDFNGKRPVEFRVLVVPKCYCDGVPPEQCPAAQIDDIEFRLAALSAGNTYNDLNADLEVDNLCPNVVEGPVYFRVTIDDLGKLDRSPFLDDYNFGPVAFQGRRTGPGDTWHNIGGFLKLINSPSSLAVSFWTGHFEPGDASYRFVTQSSEDTEETHDLGASEGVDFGIVDGAGIPAYEGNQISSGFTSRFLTAGGEWIAEDGDGTSSGNMLDNDIQGSPARVQPQLLGEGGGGLVGGIDPPEYHWCSYKEVFNNHFSQDLFRGIIYAGFIGPVPVNIWASIGLGLSFQLGAYIDVKVAPFEVLSGGNFVETSFALLSKAAISIPCEVSCDILGGLASVALRLRPEAELEVDPYINLALSTADPEFDLGFYLGAFFNLYMEAEACLQTIIFGEQCLPTITIPLVECAELFPEQNPDKRPHPENCESGESDDYPKPECGAGSGGAGGGVFESHFMQQANAPVTLISPDHQTVVDAWVQAEAGALLKVCVNQEPIAAATFPLTRFYLFHPAASFVSNDAVFFAWLQPSTAFLPAEPPANPDHPMYLPSRNLNAAHAEIGVSVLREEGGVWQFKQTGALVIDLAVISDEDSLPPEDHRADGKPTIAGDLSPQAIAAGGEALVAWVRYESDYLKLEGVQQKYLPKLQGDNCGPGAGKNGICLRSIAVVRPWMENSAIYVRRVGLEGPIAGQDKLKISDPGINIEPNIALSPSGQLGYCAWVHDPVHQDLIGSNRGRHLVVARYAKATDSWSAPVDAVAVPDDFPGILEPRIILKDDGGNGLGNGLLCFTALDKSAPEDDSGLVGGGRFLYASRLIDGAFGAPFRIHGRCEARVYGWGQSVSFDLPTLVDPTTQIHTKLPEWVMIYQQTGPLGSPDGAGNVNVTLLNAGENEWTPPVSLLPQGDIISNVRATVAGGKLHAIHLNGGPAQIEVGAGGRRGGGAGLAEPSFQVMEKKMEPDLAIAGCTLIDQFSAPGSRVELLVEIENRGLAGSPTDNRGRSLAGVQAILVRADGRETIAATEMLRQELLAGGSTSLRLTVEMPHDPARVRVQLGPNPVDASLLNNWKECFLGAPAPRELSCSWSPPRGDDGEVHPVLTWTNVGIYDEVLIYRDGSMLAALPGSSRMFSDLHAALEPHIYDVRGRVGVSKSTRTRCRLELPGAEPGFRRGDADGSDGLNITDPVFTLSFLFSGGRTPPCLKAADADDSGRLDITDPIYTLAFLFLGGPRPPAPGPEACGVDPTEDRITCEVEPRCP